MKFVQGYLISLWTYKCSVVMLAGMIKLTLQHLEYYLPSIDWYYQGNHQNIHSP